MTAFGHLGTDLAVAPHLVAHDAQALDLNARMVPLTAHLRRLLADHGVPEPERDVAGDLSTLTGRENLAQALLLRLLTPRGALAALGHATYGSRLHELIGQNKTESLRLLCRAFVLEAVRQEPRVEDAATDLAFDPASEDGSTFVFTLGVRPLAGGDPVTLGLELAL
jgi:phage baseplate assembly protein W